VIRHVESGVACLSAGLTPNRGAKGFVNLNRKKLSPTPSKTAFITFCATSRVNIKMLQTAKTLQRYGLLVHPVVVQHRWGLRVRGPKNFCVTPGGGIFTVIASHPLFLLRNRGFETSHAFCVTLWCGTNGDRRCFYIRTHGPDLRLI
jgi:hypothetical protein